MDKKRFGNFDEWWEEAAYMEVQNFKDGDTTEYGYANAAWDTRQEEIDELKTEINELIRANAHLREENNILQRRKDNSERLEKLLIEIKGEL